MSVVSSETIQVAAPSGTMFVVIMEGGTDGAANEVSIIIGKAGTQVAAWAQAVEILINALFERGASYDFVMECLRDITSDRVAHGLTRVMRSDIEAVYYAMNLYRSGRAAQTPPIYEMEVIGGRNASVAPWANVRER